MEDKINIAEILRDMPKGTKLYSPLFGDVELKEIKESHNNPVVVSTNGFAYSGNQEFDENGVYDNRYTNSEPLLFPSKEMRDWSKFAWKKGDVLINQNRTTHIIFEKFINNTYTIFTGMYYRQDGRYEDFQVRSNALTERFTIETEDAAQTYINTIEEELGGKLNRETLEIEKQPEFKDGDIVYIINKSEPYGYISIYKKQEGNYIYRYAIMREIDKSIETAKNGYLFDDNLSKRHATESEKQQLFDALAKKDKRWDAEKKQIVDLPKECELKPFDKVLSRMSSKDYWKLNFYSHKTDYYHKCIDGSTYLYCVPYNENTKHLLGTTDEWEDCVQ